MMRPYEAWRALERIRNHKYLQILRLYRDIYQKSQTFPEGFHNIIALYDGAYSELFIFYIYT